MKTINKTTAQTFNKSLAGAMVSACAAQCLTVSGFKSGCPKLAAATADAKRAPKQAAAPASAMASVVESAKTVAKGKVENYSDEVTVQLLAEYEASEKNDEAVKSLAEKFGKTARSIVAKLSREGVYKKKVYTTKQGGAPVSKEQHVKAIAAFMGVDADKLESLEKANKGVLQMVENAVKDGAHTYQNNTEDSEELKADKAALLADIYEATGAMPGDLDSLKLAKKEALHIIAVALCGSDEFTEQQAG